MGGIENLSMTPESIRVMADPDELRRRLPANLDAMMAERGVSRSGLARSLGQSRASVTNYLTGYRVPGMRQVLAMAEALSCSVDELLADVAPGDGPAGKREGES